MRTGAALALVLMLLSASIAGSQSSIGFDLFAADTTRRGAIVEAVCLRAEGAVRPPQFHALQVIRGAAPDTFTAASIFWRPLSRPEFIVGETYLLGLGPRELVPRYEVVERFTAVERPQWSVRAIERLSASNVGRLGGRDSAIAAAAESWDARGRRPPATPPPAWSPAQRDTLIAHLMAAVRAGKPTVKRLSNGQLAYPVDSGDSVGVPFEWLSVASPLEQHPDSAVRRIAFALWDTTRVHSIRRLSLFLTAADSSPAARRWLVQLSPTGVQRLDAAIAVRLLQDSTAEARSLAWRLLLASHPGDWTERYAFIALRHDTSDRMRAERWRRVSAGETKPYSPWAEVWIDNPPERWDNWNAARSWTQAEAWRAFDDTSSRLRVVGTRVLCVRRDSGAVARAIRRVRTRRGPQGQKLSSDELVSIVEVLPDSKRLEALRFDCDLAQRHDALGTAALYTIGYIDTAEVRRVLRRRAGYTGKRDSGDQADAAARLLARWAHREDLPTFHRLVLRARDPAAEEALYAIGRLEGPKAMALWIAKRYHGPPPREMWLRYTSIEDRVRSESR